MRQRKLKSIPKEIRSLRYRLKTISTRLVSFYIFISFFWLSIELQFSSFQKNNLDMTAPFEVLYLISLGMLTKPTDWWSASTRAEVTLTMMSLIFKLLSPSIYTAKFMKRKVVFQLLLLMLHG